MLDLVAQDRSANIIQVFLFVELRRVDADHDDVIGIRLFEFLELRQDMDAIDTAVSPEIEDHELATQIAQIDRPAGVEPARTAVERRGRGAFGKRMFWCCSGILSLSSGGAAVPGIANRQPTASAAATTNPTTNIRVRNCPKINSITIGSPKVLIGLKMKPPQTSSLYRN